MNSLSKILIISLVALSLFGAEKPSPAVQAILDKAQTAVEKNYNAYEAANAKPLAEAEKALKALMDAKTKSGDLDSAVLIKKTLESFQSEVVASAEAKVKSQDVLGNAAAKVDLPVYIGVWNIANLTTLKVFADGTAFWGSTPGTYTVTESTLKFSWGNEIDIPKSAKCKVVDHGRNEVVYDVTITKIKGK